MSGGAFVLDLVVTTNRCGRPSPHVLLKGIVVLLKAPVASVGRESVGGVGGGGGRGVLRVCLHCDPTKAIYIDTSTHKPWPAATHNFKVRHTHTLTHTQRCERETRRCGLFVDVTIIIVFSKLLLSCVTTRRGPCVP